MNRYSRQTVLPEITSSGQARLKKAKVLCVGMGGLGSPVSLYLAAAGVGHLGLIDADSVDESNLQRQVLYVTEDQGRPKVECARDRLLELNPEITVVTHHEFFTAENALALASQYDLLIDGSDRFATKFLVNDVACKLGIPMIYGAVNRFEGQVALFWGRHGACYRCLFPAPPQANIRNCAEAGVLGPVVGTIGTLQATLALQVLVASDDPTHPLYPKIGELTLLDLRGQWDFRRIQVGKAPSCPTCSRAPEDIELRDSPQPDICATNLPAPKLIHAESVLRMRTASDANIMLIDVRESDEWAQGHIPGATHWALSRLEKGEIPPTPSPQCTTIVYCQSGRRSQRAARLLAQAGILTVFSLENGVESWLEPLVRD